MLKIIATNPNIILDKPVIEETKLTVEFIIEKLAYESTYMEVNEARIFNKLEKPDVEIMSRGYIWLDKGKPYESFQEIK